MAGHRCWSVVTRIRNTRIDFRFCVAAMKAWGRIRPPTMHLVDVVSDCHADITC